MILSYELPKKDEKNDNGDLNTDTISSDKNLNMQNLFVYDKKFSNTFARHKAQNDDTFLEKYDELRMGNFTTKQSGFQYEFSGSNNSESDISKEDNYINTDVLKLLNASNKRNSSNMSESSLNISGIIEEEIIKKDKKNQENKGQDIFRKIDKKENLDQECLEELYSNMNKITTDDIKNISLDSSLVSDISYSGKNFIRKELLYKDSPGIGKVPSLSNLSDVSQNKSAINLNEMIKSEENLNNFPTISGYKNFNNYFNSGLVNDSPMLKNFLNVNEPIQLGGYNNKVRNSNNNTTTPYNNDVNPPTNLNKNHNPNNIQNNSNNIYVNNYGNENNIIYNKNPNEEDDYEYNQGYPIMYDNMNTTNYGKINNMNLINNISMIPNYMGGVSNTNNFNENKMNMYNNNYQINNSIVEDNMEMYHRQNNYNKNFHFSNRSNNYNIPNNYNFINNNMNNNMNNNLNNNLNYNINNNMNNTINNNMNNNMNNKMNNNINNMNNNMKLIGNIQQMQKTFYDEYESHENHNNFIDMGNNPNMNYIYNNNKMVTQILNQSNSINNNLNNPINNINHPTMNINNRNNFNNNIRGNMNRNNQSGNNQTSNPNISQINLSNKNLQILSSLKNNDNHYHSKNSKETNLGELSQNLNNVNSLNNPNNFNTQMNSSKNQKNIKKSSIESMENSPKTPTNNKKHSKINKQANYSDMSNEEISKLSISLAKEQAGCRFLQKKLEEDPSYSDRVLFSSIFNSMLELMIDAFGNYLIQKMIEYSNDTNFEKILFIICPCILSLGLNTHGTRVIQKVIERIRKESHLNIFLEAFHPLILDLIKDVNGNHIIIKFVNAIQFPENQELYNIIMERIVEIATHKHACCAFQKCIDAATPEQKMKMIHKLVDNTYILISDPYGNYVIQYIIQLNNFTTNHKIATIFKNNIGYLSKQKFSSNVIEKCFDFCDDETKFLIVKEICNQKIILDLMMDMYGNYVLQKALACAENPYKSLILNTIGPHLEKLKTVSFGSKLYSKLILAYPDLNSFLIGGNNNINTNVVNKQTKKKINTDGNTQSYKKQNYNNNNNYRNNIQTVNHNNYYDAELETSHKMITNTNPKFSPNFSNFNNTNNSSYIPKKNSHQQQNKKRQNFDEY